MSAHLKSKKYDYAMYGGVEDDASLDIVKYKLEIAFPVEESSNGVYKLGSVNIDLNDDYNASLYCLCSRLGRRNEEYALC